MPNTKSALKRMRSDEKKCSANQAMLTELKTLRKKLDTFAKENPTRAQETAHELISKLDKAVSRGIIPHRRADRKKTRVAHLLSHLAK